MLNLTAQTFQAVPVMSKEMENYKIKIPIYTSRGSSYITFHKSISLTQNASFKILLHLKDS